MMEYFEDGMQSLRMTYYPPCPQPELVTGITPHSDATILTFLLQLNGVDGLHIHKDGCWFPVSILPNALVVNVGDILEVQIFLSSLSCVLNMVLFSNTSSNYDSYSKLVPNFRFSSWVLRILVSYQLGIFFFQFDDIFFFLFWYLYFFCPIWYINFSNMLTMFFLMR